mmetsp:Transcript_6325/g.9209  ORF Transcript_6325/g.9209 Transcript_6325/m.9209 type:complete len:233 (+) Transcript_6325:241-939(+)
MKLIIALLATVFLATLLIQSTVATLTCANKGGNLATKSTIESYCPQWNDQFSCCDEAEVKTYFETERQVCGRKFNMASGKCEKELRGWLCFSLCAPDQITANYTNIAGQLKVCDNYAHDTFEQCRGKLHCPMKTPTGDSNAAAGCQTDTASTDGCYSIGQAYHDKITFVENEITGFIGLNLSGYNTGSKPKQEYKFNVDVQDGSYRTCFAAASSTTFSVATLLIAVVIAMFA